MGDQYQPLAISHAGRYSPALLQAVDRALQVKPEDRTPSVDAFRTDVGLGDAPAVTCGGCACGAAQWRYGCSGSAPPDEPAVESLV